jgi:hypothetical protein
MEENNVYNDVNLDLLIDAVETLTTVPQNKKVFLSQTELMRDRFGLTKKTHTKKRKKKKR